MGCEGFVHVLYLVGLWGFFFGGGGGGGGGGSKVEGLELCIHNFNDVFQHTTQ